MKFPYIVLGDYRLPIETPLQEPRIVGVELTALTTELGLRATRTNASPWLDASCLGGWLSYELKAEVRTPALFARHHSSPGDWHNDGPDRLGFWGCGVVVWSSKNPTQFFYKNEVYTPKPFQVVLFRNRGLQHRQHGSTEGRWFFRQYVALSAKFREVLA